MIQLQETICSQQTRIRINFCTSHKVVPIDPCIYIYWAIHTFTYARGMPVTYTSGTLVANLSLMSFAADFWLIYFTNDTDD